jgi:thiol:disulfide interchange protein DsbA
VKLARTRNTAATRSDADRNFLIFEDPPMFRRAVVRFPLLLSTLLLATACTAAPDASTTATATTAVASPAAPVAAASTAATASAAAVASAAADASAPVASSAAAAAVAAPKGLPAGPTPVEGTDYFLIDTPEQPSGSKVQVVEVFGYGCPHCNAFQPTLAAWEKKQPADVEFNYLPAGFGPGSPHCWDEFAHAFYTGQAMGVPVSKSHDGIYKAVWDQHRFTGDCSVIPSLYADYGVDAKIFASTMQSFAVGAKVAAARDQETRWGVEGTPTIIVDGKYRVLETAAGPAAFLHAVDWLIAKQRPLHAKS